MKAYAAVLRDAGRPFRVEPVRLGALRPADVLVRIEAAGICHTDLLARFGVPMALPMVLGHEGAGVVESVGAAVTRVRPGDHVVLSFDSCGACERCLTGEPAYCAEFGARNIAGRRADGSTGMTTEDGEPLADRWFGQSSFATHAVATERNVVVVDPDLPWSVLAPLGCSVQTGAGTVLGRLEVGPGSRFAVIGAGAVGLAAVMAARLAGAAEIVTVERHPGRRKLAEELGATQVLDGADPGVPGLDAVLDTTGDPGLAVAGLRLLRPGGVCALVGTGGRELTLPAGVLLGGRTLTYVMEGDAVPQLLVPRLAGWWATGRFPVDRLVRTYPLTAVDRAETDMRSGDVVKPVLLPNEETS
jgi:aryl-alcohol dehydrogenase